MIRLDFNEQYDDCLISWAFVNEVQAKITFNNYIQSMNATSISICKHTHEIYDDMGFKVFLAEQKLKL